MNSIKTEINQWTEELSGLARIFLCNRVGLIVTVAVLSLAIWGGGK